MNITIMRQVKFNAGHRLLGHEGKCANLHGHNYVVEFHISGSEIDELGRVVDFAVVKDLFKGWIDRHWDHGFIVWDQDTNAIEALEQVQPNRIYKLPYNPTAENIARYLLEVVSPELISTIKGYDLRVTSVVVWETENAYACVSVDDSRNRADAILQRAHQSTYN